MGDLTRAMNIIQSVNKADGTLTINHLIAAFADVRAEEREACAKVCDDALAPTPAMRIRSRRSIGDAPPLPGDAGKDGNG